MCQTPSKKEGLTNERTDKETRLFVRPSARSFVCLCICQGRASYGCFI